MENEETPNDEVDEVVETVPSKILRKRNEDLTYTHIRDLEFDNGFRHAFIRLVPASDTVDSAAIHTYDWDDVSVDLDDNGNIIGVTLTRYAEGM